MLKGKTTIELTDINTGEVTVVEDTNFVTNAIRDLCQPILRNHNTFHNVYSMYTGQISLNELFGGILLFDTPLEENPDNYFPPITANMTGHGSNITYTGIDLSLGSFNNSLSELSSSTSRKFVWDFTAEQANGNIASVCLTTVEGGLIGHGTKTPCEVSASVQRLFGCFKHSDFICYTEVDKTYFVPVYLSFRDDYVLYMTVSGITSGILRFVKFPIWTNKEDIFNNMNAVNSVGGTTSNKIGFGYTEMSSNIAVNLTSALGTQGYLGIAQDGKYLYIARNTNDAWNNNWIENTKINVVKLNLEDLTYEYFEVTNTTGELCNIFVSTDYYLFSDGYSFGIADNYMFVPSKANPGRMYAINLQDNTIVHTVKTYDGNEDVIQNSNTYYRGFGITVNNNVIFVDVPNAGIHDRNSNTVYNPVKCVNTNDFVLKSLNCPYWGMSARDTSMNSVSDRSFPTDNPLYFGLTYVSRIGTDAKAFNSAIAFVPNVLMTINNLETPVTKTPSQTMRITYTITKEE